MPIIKLLTADRKTFTIDEKIIDRWLYIRKLIETNSIDGGNDTKILPLPMINSHIMLKVIDWFNHYEDEPKITAAEIRHYSADPNIATKITEWDKNFFDTDNGTLYDLIKASNYFGIKALKDTACQYIANMMEGKSTEELRKEFNIMKDSDDCDNDVEIISEENSL